jgi:hypothetical protein
MIGEVLSDPLREPPPPGGEVPTPLLRRLRPSAEDGRLSECTFRSCAASTSFKSSSP